MQGDEHGDKIPESSYYRDFCDHCGEPIRVTYTSIYRMIESKIHLMNSCIVCTNCKAKEHPGYNTTLEVGCNYWMSNLHDNSVKIYEK